MQIVVDVNTDRGERRRPPTQPKLRGFQPDNPNSCEKKEDSNIPYPNIGQTISIGELLLSVKN